MIVNVNCYLNNSVDIHVHVFAFPFDVLMFVRKNTAIDEIIEGCVFAGNNCISHIRPAKKKIFLFQICRS